MQSYSRRNSKKKATLSLEQEVEFDECYVVAGQKGQPCKVMERKREARCRRLKGKRGRGSAIDEKNPIFGMVQRKGTLVLKVVENVQQKTIRPIIAECVDKHAQIFTDEYNIYNRLQQWGYKHKVVQHGQGEYARDEDDHHGMEMDFMKYIATHWKVFGLYSEVG